MTNAVIEAVGLHKAFGETKALKGLDFDVREGTILGMLGPNGAGKTTAVGGDVRTRGSDRVRGVQPEDGPARQ